MLKEIKMYRVHDEDKLYRKKQIDFLHGIWCTDNFECRNMSMKEAFDNSKYISGCVIDESIKNCLIFTFFDPVNYSVDRDTFVEISYENLMEWCEKIEVVNHVENNKVEK